MRTQNPAHAGFQLYTVAPEFLVARVPEGVELTSTCVLPLCLSTAAAGLYEVGYLGLEVPSLSKGVVDGKEKQEEEVILIWGGSSTVGSCAIQLCVAAGLTVLTTASARNHQYVRDLGARYVFDHADGEVVERLVGAAVGKRVVGVYDVISNEETALKCAEFLHRCGGGTLFATRPGGFAPEEVLLGGVRRVAGKWCSFF